MNLIPRLKLPRLVLGLAVAAALPFLVACSSGGKDADAGTPQPDQAAISATRTGAQSLTPLPVAPTSTPTPPPPPTPLPGTTPTPAPTVPAPPPGTCTPAGSQIAGVPRNNTRAFSAVPGKVIDPAKSYTATMVTSKGTIVIALNAKEAPNTVNNFVFLSCDGFYDGIVFHRVVNTPQNHFVIQAGDPHGDDPKLAGQGDPGYKFADEISPNLKHDAAGVLAMANSGPNTNGSQFYITLSPQPSLDGKYNIFGKVTSGLDVANNIVQGDKILTVSVAEN
jgi:peptidyl-prolyl cis-trans isomerase B (cyclophilin B)